MPPVVAAAPPQRRVQKLQRNERRTQELLEQVDAFFPIAAVERMIRRALVDVRAWQGIIFSNYLVPRDLPSAGILGAYSRAPHPLRTDFFPPQDMDTLRLQGEVAPLLGGVLENLVTEIAMDARPFMNMQLTVKAWRRGAARGRDVAATVAELEQNAELYAWLAEPRLGPEGALLRGFSGRAIRALVNRAGIWNIDHGIYNEVRAFVSHAVFGAVRAAIAVRSTRSQTITAEGMRQAIQTALGVTPYGSPP
jgi:hypothetical protein